ncbi:MAG: hypothetical protein R3Y13_04635 [bacterium]
MNEKEKIKWRLRYSDCSSMELDSFYNSLLKESNIKDKDFLLTNEEFLNKHVYKSNDIEILVFASMYFIDVDVDLIFKKIISNQFYQKTKIDIASLIKFVNNVDSKYSQQIFEELIIRKSISDCLVFYNATSGVSADYFEYEIIFSGSALDIINYLKTNKDVDLKEFYEKINNINIREEVVLNFLYRKGDIDLEVSAFAEYACAHNSLSIMKEIIPYINDKKIIKNMTDIIIEKNQSTSFDYEKCKLIEDIIKKDYKYRTDELCNIFIKHSCFLTIDEFFLNNHEKVNLKIYEDYLLKENDTVTFENFKKKISNNDSLNKNESNCNLIFEKITKFIELMKETKDSEELLKNFDFENDYYLLVPNFINLLTLKMKEEKLDSEIIYNLIKLKLNNLINEDKCNDEIFFKYCNLFIYSNDTNEMIKFLKEFNIYAPDFFAFEDAIINNFDIESSFEFLRLFPFADKNKFRYAFVINTNEFIVSEFDKLYSVNYNNELPKIK